MIPLGHSARRDGLDLDPLVNGDGLDKSEVESLGLVRP